MFQNAGPCSILLVGPQGLVQEDPSIVASNKDSNASITPPATLLHISVQDFRDAICTSITAQGPPLVLRQLFMPMWYCWTPTDYLYHKTIAMIEHTNSVVIPNPKFQYGWQCSDHIEIYKWHMLANCMRTPCWHPHLGTVASHCRLAGIVEVTEIFKQQWHFRSHFLDLIDTQKKS
jgi:hypothetical protein